MADHPLRPATDRSLGEPLPHQLANQTHTHPLAINLYSERHAPLEDHGGLVHISMGYPPLKGRSYTRYAPVRHSSAGPKSPVTVRLACVRPAASVRPEPGSNSPYYYSFGIDYRFKFYLTYALLNFNFSSEKPPFLSSRPASSVRQIT